MDLDITKACGPDGIPAILLKECAYEIAPTLCMIFNTSLKTACLPKEWKEANVTPVHKKDSKEPASNYRPISLLCLVNKVLERCVGKRLYCHNYKKRHHPITTRFHAKSLLCLSVTVSPRFHWKKTSITTFKQRFCI